MQANEGRLFGADATTDTLPRCLACARAGERKAAWALADRRRTAALLAVVLARLYTLRNQLMHGGATWQGGVNRDQIRDGTAILSELVPRVIHLLIDNPVEDWGKPCYPVVDMSFKPE